MENKNHLNGEIHYIVEGKGPPVILLHGVAASHFSWKYLIPELVEHGYRAIALDLPGHGDSFKPSRKEGFLFTSLYSSCANWIGSLDIEQPCVLVGHSLGGAFSLQYALDRPEQVAGLVLIDPLFYPRQITAYLKPITVWPAIWETALRFAPYKLLHLVSAYKECNGNSNSQEIRSQTAKDYKRAAPGVVRITGSIPDLSLVAPRIASPSLVIWGEKDPTLQPGSFPQLVDLLPNSKGYAIPDCGHNPHLGNPELVERLVCDFLGEVTGQRLYNIP